MADKAAEVLEYLNKNYPSQEEYERGRSPQCADDYAEWHLAETIREMINGGGTGG